MYMSYCRFEGTFTELKACMATVDEHVNEEAEYEVSDREINYFTRMVTEFVDWLNDQCLLDEYGEVDEAMLETVCEAMRKRYCEEE